MADVTSLGDLKQGDSPMGSEIGQLRRLLAIDPVDGRELPAQLQIELAVEARLHEKQDSGGEKAYDQRQHARVPERQARAHAQRAGIHPCFPPKTNPTPRTV